MLSKYDTKSLPCSVSISASSSSNTIIDSVQAHLLLNPGGTLIFDDYLWRGLLKIPETPKSAIDAFLDCFSKEYEVLYIGYQVIIRKLVV